ncbi:MAG: CHAT domain-containing protein [Alkalinema sp. RU_4_3]|nr:CHAT domain-containing protein [Alkalinema sp. RU_4_3]
MSNGDGGHRAALGIAGVALRSGARSTIASLWGVDDQATSI